jgi:hypothetical protein
VTHLKPINRKARRVVDLTRSERPGRCPTRTVSLPKKRVRSCSRQSVVSSITIDLFEAATYQYLRTIDLDGDVTTAFYVVPRQGTTK